MGAVVRVIVVATSLPPRAAAAPTAGAVLPQLLLLFPTPEYYLVLPLLPLPPLLLRLVLLLLLLPLLLPLLVQLL